MTEKSTQLAVIGAGPGGYAAAFLAADLGLQVTIIDPEANPGGVCLYRGCIPSKTLLHAAHLAEAARKADTWGLRFEGLSVDVAALRRHKDRVVAQLTEGLGQLVKRRKIEHLRGRAVFADEGRLTVEDSGGRRQALAFEQAIIATGSRAANNARVAGGRRRVYRAGTGQCLRRSGRQGQPGGNDASPAARRGPRPGAVSAQTPGEPV
jgi:dihydrolipoamide dehydrogenase